MCVAELWCTSLATRNSRCLNYCHKYVNREPRRSSGSPRTLEVRDVDRNMTKDLHSREAPSSGKSYVGGKI
jgi:hypothetical protein